MKRASFDQRAASLAAQRGRLCVGLDPHESLVRSWGLDYDVSGIEKLARDTIAALGDQVMIFKPQSALFEVFGSRGIAALARVLADVRAAGALSILDVKRGDIGSTMAAYARAYLSDDAELVADAITLSPYLGFESLRPAIDLAHANGRGVFVLCHTSNPEGAEVQFALHQGTTVAQQVVDAAQRENFSSGQNNIGLVIGATHDSAGVDLSAYSGWILAPGIGAQGGTMAGLQAIFGERADHVLPSSSRGILSAGPSPEALRASVSSLISR
jgi:orotidine-5'-phosphate decarboxylase